MWRPCVGVWLRRLVAREGAQRRLAGWAEAAKCVLQQPQATVNARTWERVSDAGEVHRRHMGPHGQAIDKVWSGLVHCSSRCVASNSVPLEGAC